MGTLRRIKLLVDTFLIARPTPQASLFSQLSLLWATFLELLALYLQWNQYQSNCNKKEPKIPSKDYGPIIKFYHWTFSNLNRYKTTTQINKRKTATKKREREIVKRQNTTNVNGIMDYLRETPQKEAQNKKHQSCFADFGSCMRRSSKQICGLEAPWKYFM